MALKNIGDYSQAWKLAANFAGNPGKLKVFNIKFSNLNLFFYRQTIFFLANDHNAIFRGDPFPFYRQTDNNRKGLKKEKG